MTRLTIISHHSLLKGPKLPIFYRPDSNTTMREIFKVPLEAAREFCADIKSKTSKGTTYYVITGGNVDAHKDLLNWIVDCCNSPEGTKTRFQTYDDDVAFFYYPQVMQSAEQLGIKGFAAGLHRRMMALARKNLMTLDDVYMYYGMDPDPKLRFPAQLKLGQVAVESVFFARYEKKKGRWNDANEAELAVLRQDIPGFEQDMDDRMEAKIAERQAWLKEQDDIKKRGEMGDAGSGTGSSNDRNSIH